MPSESQSHREQGQAHESDIRALRNEMQEMKDVMKDVASALTRLALLEERQQAFTTVNSKMMDRLEHLQTRQHESDIRFASYPELNNRVGAIETAVREMHVEREKDKASLRTAVWLIRGAWLLLGGGGAAVLIRLFATGTP